MADTDTTSKEPTVTGVQTYRSSPQLNPGSIDDQLRALKQELDALEGNLSAQSKLRDALKADFAVLEKNAGDVKKSPDEYEAGLPGLEQEKKLLDDYYKPKIEIVKGSLGDKVEKIKAQIGGVDNAIKAIRDGLPGKKSAIKEVGEQYEVAKEALEGAQKNYDELKNLLKISLDNIKKMKDWRKTIEEFDDKNDHKSMYVYLRELKSLFDITFKNNKVKTKDEYIAELRTAWTNLNNAKDDARDKQLTWDEKKNDLTQAQDDLKRLEENRVKNILEKIKDV